MRERLQSSAIRLQKRASLALILLCLFFLATRIFQITQNPPALYWDEASIGYNSYSILTTGHDEWGKAFPIHFRAFGEFKLPVYIYSTAVSEAFFGLSAFAIRLPAVLYSLGSLLLIYSILLKITQRKLAGLLGAFAFAIQPWMFIFSRTGYEATAGVFFILLAVYFFLQSQTNKYYILAATASLILSMYSYNSFRLLSGLTIVMALGYLLWISRTKKTILLCLLSLIIFAVSTYPILRLLLYDTGFSRVEAFALLPNIQQVYDLHGNAHLQLIMDRSHPYDWSGNLRMIIGNYLTHFSPNFLFINGDPNPRNQMPGVGQLYLIDGIFIILGFLALFKLRKFYVGVIIFLLLIAPIPASLFKEVPHALRAILMAPIFAIFVGLGIFWLYEKKRIFLIPVLAIYILLFAFYSLNFLANFPVKTSADWQYGYYEIYQLYSSQFSNYDKILISDHDAQPYIFPLVYLKVDPRQFQKTVQRNPYNNWGFSTVSSFNNFQFGKVDKILSQESGHFLVFASDEDKLPNVTPDHEIRFLNGKTAYYVYQINK